LHFRRDRERYLPASAISLRLASSPAPAMPWAGFQECWDFSSAHLIATFTRIKLLATFHQMPLGTFRQDRHQ
jgi:hypothetical protein